LVDLLHPPLTDILVNNNSQYEVPPKQFTRIDHSMEDEQPLLRFNCEFSHYSTNHNLATRHIYEKDSDICFKGECT
jgi:hypothetical protein